MRWWLVGIAVVLILVVIVVARGRSTAPRRPVPKRPPSRPAPKTTKTAAKTATKTAVAAPQPGEIWWADVPYEDGSGHKVRPCLVLRTRRGVVDVLKITSQDQSHRNDHIEITTRTWDHNADHNSYLDLTDPIPVRIESFEDRAGDLDAPTWQKVRKLHSIR